MLRFGDDVTEEILQYLTFEDKIRLECVSKQWQRCVFNKLFVIEIYVDINLRTLRIDLNLQNLESLLKKCPNISRVVLMTNVMNKSSVLSLIGRYCHRIKSLDFWPDFAEEDGDCLSFFRMYGHKLEEFKMDEDSDILHHIYRHCPNLKIVNYYQNSNLHDKTY